MIDFEYSIDEATWYYLEEGNKGLFEFLEFMNDNKNIDEEKLKEIGISIEEKNNINQYYNYVYKNLKNIRNMLLKKCSLDDDECKIDMGDIEHEYDESYQKITFFTNNIKGRRGKKGAISMYIGIYCAEEIEVAINNEKIKHPVVSIGFYDDEENGISNEAFNEIKENDENAENTLDFYKNYNTFMTSYSIAIKEIKDVNQAFKDIIDYAKKQLKYMYDVVNKY